MRPGANQIDDSRVPSSPIFSYKGGVDVDVKGHGMNNIARPMVALMYWLGSPALGFLGVELGIWLAMHLL